MAVQKQVWLKQSQARRRIEAARQQQQLLLHSRAQAFQSKVDAIRSVALNPRDPAENPRDPGKNPRDPAETVRQWGLMRGNIAVNGSASHWSVFVSFMRLHCIGSMQATSPSRIVDVLAVLCFGHSAISVTVYVRCDVAEPHHCSSTCPSSVQNAYTLLTWHPQHRKRSCIGVLQACAQTQVQRAQVPQS